MRSRLALAALLLLGIAAAQKPNVSTRPKPAPAKPPAGAAKLVPKLPATVDGILNAMTLRDRVAQLVMATCYGEGISVNSATFRKYRHWVEDVHVGGFIVANTAGRNGSIRPAEPAAMAILLNRLQRLSYVPLIVGADFERGASMRVEGGTLFPYNMAYGAAADFEADKFEGLTAAREARAVGVHWIFAPVADVNSNPENPIINIRSYGENPDLVAQHVAAYIEGAHSDPEHYVLVTAKHFPGHGDTNIDSHLNLARLDATREHMDAVELKPFQAAIAHGVDSIMTAHMSVPAIEPEDIPATVSPKVLTELLREQLKFQGLVITDAMDMQGLAAIYETGEASVKAIQAGADVLLMPPNPERSIQAVMAAIKDGRITKDRIDQSVKRILTAKIKVGLLKGKFVNPENIFDTFGTADADERAQQVSDRAVTFDHNNASVVPLKDPDHSCLVMLLRGRNSSFGEKLVTDFKKRAPHARALFVDGSLPLAAMEVALGDTSDCSAIVVVAFVNVAAYRGNVALTGDLVPFAKEISEGKVPSIFIAMGNPYLISLFPKTAASIATFSTTLPSEVSAVKALLGDIAATGHMPVTIPPAESDAATQ
jgi:beta-N-acetylhexosaminidase